MLGKDYELKLIDFDMSIKGANEQILNRGTKNYRAPEILAGNCANPAAADIFSMAMILFVLRTRGYFA